MIRPSQAKPSDGSLAGRVCNIDWAAAAAGLDDVGMAPVGSLLFGAECRTLANLYDDPTRFRATIEMARHRFGEGQYRYFDHPLPDEITELRSSFWPHLLPIARQWADRRNQPAPWPDDFSEWLTMCHEAGQGRPTPLMLSYGPGGWNALHRDLYGELYFPLQVVIGLDRPGTDYTGGEFVMVEQRPRAQSRAVTTSIGQGHGLVFTTNDRPIRTKRGWAKGPTRHGVSTILTGRRRALGIIFHDAE